MNTFKKNILFLLFGLSNIITVSLYSMNPDDIFEDSPTSIETYNDDAEFSFEELIFEQAPFFQEEREEREEEEIKKKDHATFFGCGEKKFRDYLQKKEQENFYKPSQKKIKKSEKELTIEKHNLESSQKTACKYYTKKNTTKKTPKKRKSKKILKMPKSSPTNSKEPSIKSNHEKEDSAILILKIEDAPFDIEFDALHDCKIVNKAIEKIKREAKKQREIRGQKERAKREKERAERNERIKQEEERRERERRKAAEIEKKQKMAIEKFSITRKDPKQRVSIEKSLLTISLKKLKKNNVNY